MRKIGAARALDPWRWIGIPTALCIILTLVLGIPIRAFGWPLPEPVWAMAPAFAWAVIRPAALSPLALLVMGVFMDVFWGSPLGLWSLSLLIAYGAVLSARNMLVGQSRWMLWFWYGVTCTIGELAGFLFTRLDVEQTPNLIAVLWQLIATIVLYPFAYRLIDRYEDADVRFR